MGTGGPHITGIMGTGVPILPGLWGRGSPYYRDTGPVFALPIVDPVQFLLGQKWTRSSFTSPMVDPVQFSLSQKWTCLVFVQPKVDLYSSSGVLLNKSGLHIQIAFSDYDIELCVHSFTLLLAAIYLSVLFEPYYPRYMPLSVYSHWHTHAMAIYSHTGVGFCMLVAEMGLLFQP